MSEYVYQRTEFSPYELYTVGYYDPNGKWHSESDYKTTKEAAMRVNYLNGGNSDETGRLQQENKQLRELVRSAAEDIKLCALCKVCNFSERQPNCDCECISCALNCKCKTCTDDSGFVWRHADKLKKEEVAP